MNSELPERADREEAPENGDPGREPSISLLTILWPVLLGLSVLVLIGYITFEPDAFSRIFADLNPWIMACALGAVAMRVLMGGLRLSYVSNGRLSMLGGLRGQLAWDFASNITPSLVGGAPIAAYYIARSTRENENAPIRVGEVSAFMMFIMLLDQTWFALSAPVILVAAMFMEVIPEVAGTVGSYTAISYFILFMVWTALFAYTTLFRPQLLARITDRICRLPFLRRFRERVQSEMLDYRKRAELIRSQPISFFVRGLLLSGGTWIARYVLVVFIVWSVYPAVDQLLLFFRSIAMTLGSLVMPTPGGAGGVEGLYALFFGSLMPRAFLAPTLFVWRLLGYYIFLGFGIFLSTHHVRKSIKKRKKLKVEAAPASDGDHARPVRENEPVEMGP